MASGDGPSRAAPGRRSSQQPPAARPVARRPGADGQQRPPGCTRPGRLRAAGPSWPGRWRYWERRWWSSGYWPRKAPRPPAGPGDDSRRRAPDPGRDVTRAAGRGQAGAAWISAVKERAGLPPPPRGSAQGTAALPRSRPVSLAIPAIGVHTSLIDLGLGPGPPSRSRPLPRQACRRPAGTTSGPPLASQARRSSRVTSTPTRVPACSSVSARYGPVTRSTSPAPTAPWPSSGSTPSTSTARTSFPTRQVYGPVSYAGTARHHLRRAIRLPDPPLPVQHRHLRRAHRLPGHKERVGLATATASGHRAATPAGPARPLDRRPGRKQMATCNTGFGGSGQSRNLLPNVISWPPGAICGLAGAESTA